MPLPSSLLHPLTDNGLLPDVGATVIASGEGCVVTLEDGRKLLDGSSGLFTVNLGYGRRELTDAAARQLETLAYASTFGGLASRAALDFAKRLTGLAPKGLNSVFLVSGGSEANETAVKLARRHWHRDGRPGKTIVLAHARSYHGLTGVATTATRLTPYHADFGPLAPEVVEVPVPYHSGQSLHPATRHFRPQGWH